MEGCRVRYYLEVHTVQELENIKMNIKIAVRSGPICVDTDS